MIGVLDGTSEHHILTPVFNSILFTIIQFMAERQKPLISFAATRTFGTVDLEEASAARQPLTAVVLPPVTWVLGARCALPRVDLISMRQTEHARLCVD
jgi:hypothetical protein